MSVAWSGIRAMADGASALADKEEKELDQACYEEEHAYREQSKAWREQDVGFKELEKIWRGVESKRSRLKQLSDQLESLARLASYMCLAEITVYINQNVPDESEHTLHYALLGFWGVMCVSGIVLLITIMMVATMIHMSVLQVSCHEGWEDRTPDEEQYRVDGSNPEGVVMNPQQFLHLWNGRYDDWFRRLIRAFSGSVALFFAILAPLAHVKLWISPAAAWTFTAICLLGLVIWMRYHDAMVSHLLYRPSPPARPPRAPAPAPPTTSGSALGERTRPDMVDGAGSGTEGAASGRRGPEWEGCGGRMMSGGASPSPPGSERSGVSSGGKGPPTHAPSPTLGGGKSVPRPRKTSPVPEGMTVRRGGALGDSRFSARISRPVHEGKGPAG